MICNGCHGVVGRDCFNPIECEWITQQMDQDQHEQDQIDHQNQIEAEHYAKIEREHFEQNGEDTSND